MDVIVRQWQIAVAPRWHLLLRPARPSLASWASRLRWSEETWWVLSQTRCSAKGWLSSSVEMNPSGVSFSCWAPFLIPPTSPKAAKSGLCARSEAAFFGADRCERMSPHKPVNLWRAGLLRLQHFLIMLFICNNHCKKRTLSDESPRRDLVVVQAIAWVDGVSSW